jgi:NADPH-dependent F420 reductase
MASSKTIAIIGASGKMGSAIARGLAKGKDRMLLFGKNEEKLSTVLNDILKTNPSADAEITECSVDACWEADIIVAAVPYAAEAEVAETVKQVATGKIVISISNPLNSTYDGLLTDPATSAGEELQKLLPHSKVVKAFNTTFAADFLSPVINGQTVDAFVAGDDDEAVETVSELVKTVGFNPVAAGKLTASRTLETMQALLIQLTLKNNYNSLAGWKLLHN